MPSLDPTTALLQALLMGPGHSLQLMDRIRSRTNGQASLSQSTTYRTLKKMSKMGLVKSTLGEADPIADGKGRPPRLFELTPKGEKSALAERASVGGMFTEKKTGTK